MRHQISRHKIIQYLKFLILISHIDFLIFWLPDVIHKSYCTPDEAMDNLSIKYVPAIYRVCCRSYQNAAHWVSLSSYESVWT